MRSHRSRKHDAGQPLGQDRVPETAIRSTFARAFGEDAVVATESMFRR